jgi:malate dehydrogenase
MFPPSRTPRSAASRRRRSSTTPPGSQGPFCETVGKRGAAIIAARGASSAASAANALVDHVRSTSSRPAPIHSVAVKSNGALRLRRRRLGRHAGPHDHARQSYEVITGYAMDDFAKSKIAATNKELVEERAFVAELIK